jgi:putative ABC transport system substrate-binding protein
MVASTTNLSAMRLATRTIPIVFANVSDPVVQGFVPSLMRPGGNITGFAAYEFSIGGKWLDLLKQMVPALARVSVVFNPDTSPQSHHFLRAISSAAQVLGVGVALAPVRSPAEIEAAIARAASQSNSGLLFTTDSYTQSHSPHIAEVVARHPVPAIYSSRTFVRDGGLMYYGAPNVAAHSGGAATYVDRILKGAKPGDLPVQLPTKFELIINLRAAKALGIEVPVSLLLIADEQIE